jgi:hypothetical protein
MTSCDLCNRERRNLLRMKPSEVWGDHGPTEDQHGDVMVCCSCADDLDPQEYAASITNPAGGPIPV